MIGGDKMSLFDGVVITAIHEVLLVPSPKGRYTEMKNRESYGLSFCKSGQITYTQNGTEAVSDKYHAIILPKGGSYTLYGDEAGVFPLVNFSTLSPFTDNFISIPLENPETYIKEFEKLGNASSARAFSVLYRLFDRLGDEQKQADILSPVLKYMEENLRRESLSNDELARQLNISEVYFRRIFKEKIGTTPHKYLLNLRIERAKLLLSDPALSVSLVAEAVGFSGPYHFSKAFKEAVGTTPGRYRKDLEKTKM